MSTTVSLLGNHVWFHRDGILFSLLFRRQVYLYYLLHITIYWVFTSLITWGATLTNRPNKKMCDFMPFIVKTSDECLFL
jgi:hypothetical protein